MRGNKNGKPRAFKHKPTGLEEKAMANHIRMVKIINRHELNMAIYERQYRNHDMRRDISETLERNVLLSPSHSYLYKINDAIRQYEQLIDKTNLLTGTAYLTELNKTISDHEHLLESLKPIASPIALASPIASPIASPKSEQSQNNNHDQSDDQNRAVQLIDKEIIETCTSIREETKRNPDSFENDVVKLLKENIVELKLLKSSCHKKNPSVFSEIENFQWEKLTLTLLSGDQVRIQYPDIANKTYSYAELGFKDKKSKDGSPNKNWRFLKLACKKYEWDTSINNNSLNQRDRDNLKHIISDIRKKLREFFETTGDPFHPHKNGEGWRTKFIIRNEDEV